MVASYEVYQHKIPNGDRVPNSCNKHQIWSGVGHVQMDGHGVLNAFGIDFQRLGKKWSTELCRLDSDEDGRYNGEELGDPNCIWTPESPSSISFQNISHPGICEPVDSETCRQKSSMLSCGMLAERCPSLREKETRNITIKFPKSIVPKQATTYRCLIFEFPQDGDFHIVASKPVIDNHHVMHHILLFGCDESDKGIKQELYKPFNCGMIADPKCSNVIGIWSMGMSGECSHNSSGFRIGTSGFRKGALQIHWNNPHQLEGLEDGSGLIIFYTPILRPHDAGIMVVGQYWIDLPPRKRGVVINAECSTECSNKLINSEIHITVGYNHMHYLGRQERIELYRHGIKLTDLTYDRNYSYDLPVLHTFQEPIKVLPGDQIKTSCVYSTMSRSQNVRFGDSTSDEMCLGFLTYFPKQNLKDPYCTNWKSVPMCLLWNQNSDTAIKGCYIQRLLQGHDVTANPIIQDIVQACMPFKTCSDWCRYSVNIARQHPCFHGDVLDFIGYENLHDFPEFLIPFVICDFKKEVNFSTEIVFKHSNRTVPKTEHNISSRDIPSCFTCILLLLLMHL